MKKAEMGLQQKRDYVEKERKKSGEKQQ